jgi:hypothetical protein
MGGQSGRRNETVKAEIDLDLDLVVLKISMRACQSSPSIAQSNPLAVSSIARSQTAGIL